MSEAMDRYEAARQRLKDLGCTGLNITIRDPNVDPDLIAEDAVKHLEFIEKCIEDKEFRDANSTVYSQNDLDDEDVKTECFGGLRQQCGGTGQFAKKSIAEARKAGREAGEALSRI